ncbi:GH25 family lysozyme, partial [Pseudarthrobacter sp. PvP090]|uniref:GH25 family lysozyme n=1 Tax=Pseudarthrobacter sp. PvP090 TaxID=3156393 RepID=UPI003392171D
MKRTLLQPKRHLGSRVGTVLLAASLLAGPGLASTASAVEPAPTPTVRPTATSTPAAKPSPSATTSPAPAAQAAGAPAAAKATSTDYRTAMAAAAGPGGAEMGQGLRSSDAPSRLRTEAGALATEGTWTPTFGVQGLDVSNYQATVNWQTQWDLGARFAYIKATEGNYYTSPAFRAQFQGSRGVGMLRGAYHFANPAASSGADQARIFVNGGGVWSPDGYTLPPVLDFEANPYAGQTIGGYYQGNTCYDMSPTQLTTWVRDFGRTMLSLTGRLPVIYTNTSWWKRCTGDATGFGDYPLWTAYWPSSASNYAGPLPSGWRNYSFWQYSESGPFAGDSNVWNGSYADLRTFARNSVPRAALDAIAAFTSSSSVMGSATSGITCGLRGGGCFQGFAKGVVMWSPATGAQPSLLGPIRDAWARSGYENGAMGYPTSGVICGLKNSGCFQNYQGGAIM